MTTLLQTKRFFALGVICNMCAHECIMCLRLVVPKREELKNTKELDFETEGNEKHREQDFETNVMQSERKIVKELHTV